MIRHFLRVKVTSYPKICHRNLECTATSEVRNAGTFSRIHCRRCHRERRVSDTADT